MEILEKKLETRSPSNCRVGKVSSSRPIEEDNLSAEIGLEKVDFEKLNETVDSEIF
ncbi:hypothetical protein ACFX5E_04025 [Flavobacterium sp. LS2P90]|uniref:Uncharacterized protein n=1 Tax=Flavobacterium xylosi TaxID=3230415 RepID=A0ABW6HTW9_9FLAO